VKYKKASEIKVGVVGYGGAFNMGRAHLNEMKKAGMTPVAVAEIDPERLKAATTDFPGIQTYSSLAAMLKKSDVELVTIITPHNTHAKLALQALRSGRHVVCEKPLAITTAECDEMMAAAKKSGAVLSTYHNRHWDGCIIKAAEAIRGGAIGEVVRIEARMGHWGKPGDWWRSSKSVSGGILYDWGVHLLEYSLQLIDSKITEVTGFSKQGHWSPVCSWKKDTIEDEGYTVVRFKSGQWLLLNISAIESNPRSSMLEITGTKGTYLMGGGDWQVITNQDGNQVTTKGRNPQSESWKYYQNVADHLVKGKKLVITAEWSRRPIHILDLACQSAARGKAIAAKYG